jgi:hypothetical protein
MYMHRVYVLNAKPNQTDERMGCGRIRYVL